MSLTLGLTFCWFICHYLVVVIQETKISENFICFKDSEIQRNRDHVLTDSLPKSPKLPELGQREAWSPKLNLGLPHGWQGSRHLSHNCCIPRCPSSGSWIVSRVARTQTRHLDMGCRHPKWQFNCSTKCLLLKHLLPVLPYKLSIRDVWQAFEDTKESPWLANIFNLSQKDSNVAWS